MGIINKPAFEKVKKEYQKRFLYLGRFSRVKNLEIFIKVFNDLPNHRLTLVGDGEEKSIFNLLQIKIYHLSHQ